MNLKRKIPTFVFGVSIGLVIGIAFFLFKINEIFKDLKDAAKEQITVIQQPVEVSKEEEEKKKNKERFKIHLKKTGSVNYKEVDSLIKSDQELNVATDELLSVKSVKVIYLSEGHSRDTSAARLAGVENKNTNVYFIEFWKTPLNSKGYRFTRNKIMLYGFVDFSNFLLYDLDGEHYLKSSDQVYKLSYGSDFKPLERVEDAELLAKIN